MDNWKILFTSNTPFRINLAKTYLESEGIEALLENELVYYVYSSAPGQIKLLVKEQDLEQGAKLLMKAGYIN